MAAEACGAGHPEQHLSAAALHKGRCQDGAGTPKSQPWLQNPSSGSLEAAYAIGGEGCGEEGLPSVLIPDTGGI